MLVRVLTVKVVTLFCVLILAALSASNTNAQIDWGRVLDLSPKNTEAKPERLSLEKELELGQQLREQNDRGRARLEGRGSDQGAAVNAPNIEIRGVFERGGPDRPDRPDRANDSARQSNGSQSTYGPRSRPDLMVGPNYYNSRNMNSMRSSRGNYSPIRGRLGGLMGPARLASELVKDRVQEWWQHKQAERQRYQEALRRESEANRRAAHAAWINPYSPESRSLRQAAYQASIERARAELAVQLRTQNEARSLYGVSSGPTRQQWIGPRSYYGLRYPNVRR